MKNADHAFCALTLKHASVLEDLLPALKGVGEGVGSWWDELSPRAKLLTGGIVAGKGAEGVGSYYVLHRLLQNHGSWNPPKMPTHLKGAAQSDIDNYLRQTPQSPGDDASFLDQLRGAASQVGHGVALEGAAQQNPGRMPAAMDVLQGQSMALPYGALRVAGMGALGYGAGSVLSSAFGQAIHDDTPNAEAQAIRHKHRNVARVAALLGMLGAGLSSNPDLKTPVVNGIDSVRSKLGI